MADTKEIINCPACGKLMEKVYIPHLRIHLDICTDGCGGIYFDNREFKQFDEKHEDISIILEKIEGKIFEEVDTTKIRICPVCGAKMVKNSTSVHKKIEVDDCYTCGGKFLDRDELLKIRAEYDTEEERSSDFMQHVYKEIGAELELQDLKRTMAIDNRTLLQKIFYKIVEM